MTFLAQNGSLTLIGQLEQILHFFEHAQNEDEFILPHIHKHNPQLIRELEKDHGIDQSLTRTLFDHIGQWKAASTDAQRNVLGQCISFAFSEFIAFNLYHMNKEENVLMYLLWKHFTDDQIREMEAQIIESIPAQTLMAESRWMIHQSIRRKRSS